MERNRRSISFTATQGEETKSFSPTQGKLGNPGNLVKGSKDKAKNSDEEKDASGYDNNFMVANFSLSFKKLIYVHIWLMPLFVILATYSLYFTQQTNCLTTFLEKFIFLSYKVDETSMYGKGINDLYYVLFHTVWFFFIRDFLMEIIIKPMAIRLVNTAHKQKRIMEQMFSIIYYGLSGPTGLYIMYNSDLWLFKTDKMYETYPDFTMPKSFKAFYLIQGAFWAQQASVLILQLEKPRKDYNQLIFHHIITLLLIWLSYVFHFTNMGLAIYITMDISDWFLSLTKILNYLNNKYTPHSFILFMIIWGYLRHYINLKILWSLLTEFKTVGNYTLNFATSQYKCWISQTITFILIGGLQLVNLFWSYLILRILYRLIASGIQEDERSDVESDTEPIGSISVDEKY